VICAEISMSHFCYYYCYCYCYYYFVHC